MGSFGERLRREREMRGITLDEIAESTKISRRHLESLEKEDFDSLPGGIFNRGFVRAYARYLGIDEDQAVTDYAAVSAEQLPPEDKFPLEVQLQPDPELNPRRSTLPLVLALLALVAVLAVFWTRTRNRSVESQEPAGAKASASTPSPGRSPASPAPSATSSSSELPAVTPEKVSAVGAADRNVSDVQPSPGNPQLPARTFSVAVTAKEDAWIALTVDGKTMISRVLNAGEQQSFRAGKKIVLTTGNAGGVDISFNGKPLGAIGNESEVRTLTFTSAGLVQ